MKTVRPWVEALGISEEDFQRWSSTVPAGDSVTFRCLREGRIPVDAYLDWARDHYGLAILRSEFFLQPANKSLFEKLKTVSNWSREFCPIHEWDGVIFVACVEPSEVEWSYKVQQVLATPADLEKYWNSLHAAAHTQPPPPPTAVPEVEIVEVTSAFPPTPNIPLPQKDEFTQTPVANPSRKEADPFEALSAVVQTPVSTNTIEGLDLGSAAKVDLNIPEGMGGLSATATAASFEAPGGLEGLTLTGVAAQVASAQSEPSIETLMTGLTQATVNTSTPEMPEQTSTAIRPSTGVPAPEKSLKVGKGQFESEAILRELANDFDGAMILRYSNSNLEPWAWDAKWNSASPKHIDLSGASAFRVVYRTKMPYMGHIVDTPTNSAFFKNWGHETLPEGVLIQPLLNQGTWVGMILLKCDKNKKQSQLLAAADRISPKIVDLVMSTHLKAA